MKNIITALTLAFTTLLLTQCKKEVVEQPNVTPCSETIEVSLNADNGGSKAIFNDINEKVIEWEIDDKLYVVGETNGYLGYISAQNAGTSAYFTGTITKCSTAQYFHYYYFGDKAVSDVETILKAGDYYTYDISSQYGTLDDIADNYLLMHGRSTETIASGQTNLNNITMRSMISIVKLQFGVASGTLGNKVMCTGGFSAIKFNVKTGIDADNNFVSEGRVRYKKNIYLNGVNSAKDGIYYMVVLPGTQTLEFSQGLIGLSCQGPNGGFVANTMYNTKNITLGELPYSPAIFTISIGGDNIIGTEDDTQVKFSKGNLQYQASENKWRFAEHQYSYVGNGTDGNVYVGDNKCSNLEISENYNGWIDLFGWGTSGLTGSLASHAVCWQPWSISVDDTHYLAYGDVNKDLFDPPYTADWGYNTIYAGNIATNGWRTMRNGEWGYLFSRKNNENKLLYGHGKVGTSSNYIYGLIILPDDWTLPNDLTFTYGKSAWTNTYDYTNWAKMEAAGAAFLPAAGLRYKNTETQGSNTTGYYWSSTHDSQNVCYHVKFYTNEIFPTATYYGRIYGYSVRLVKDVVEANGNANPFGPEPW